MKEFFLKLLTFANNTGKVTEALMYENGGFSKIKFETEDGTYTIGITKEQENGDR